MEGFLQVPTGLFKWKMVAVLGCLLVFEIRLKLFK